MKKINFKSLLFHLLVPIMLSFIISMLIGDYSEYYNSLVKPINVKGIVFPIVWSILYLLMGISAYIVDNSENQNSDKAMRYYYIQLVLNLLWTPTFFYFKLRGGSVILTVMLLVAVLVTAFNFFKINKVSGLLFIPYLLWTIFALYLTTGIYFLNLNI